MANHDTTRFRKVTVYSGQLISAHLWKCDQHFHLGSMANDRYQATYTDTLAWLDPLSECNATPLVKG